MCGFAHLVANASSGFGNVRSLERFDFGNDLLRVLASRNQGAYVYISCTQSEQLCEHMSSVCDVVDVLYLIKVSHELEFALDSIGHRSDALQKVLQVRPDSRLKHDGLGFYPTTCLQFNALLLFHPLCVCDDKR